MDHPSLIPSHTFAEWLLGIIDRALDAVGLARYQTTEEIIYLIVISGVAFGIAWLIKRVLYIIIKRIVRMRNGQMGRELLRMHTLSKVCQIIPPLILLGLIPFAFESSHGIRVWLMRLVGVYGMAMFGVGLGAIMDFIFYRYNTHDNKRNLPLKGLLNVAKGIMWIVIAICAVATLVDRSPAYLLTGLGAFAAALMLIFKDSILGFVAGIQMNQNDMLHVGDWIVVPGTPANGVVLDMSLSAVKVQNFDNTIVTVPPYTLISTSFQNWRGMTMSGARRIDQILNIDLTTVRRIAPAEVDAMAAPFPRLKEFVANLRAAGATEQHNTGLNPINGSLETNLGLFRAYISLYLYYNPGICKTQQLLVNTQGTNENGFQLQVYCFTNTTDWEAYEAIQSDVLEHIVTGAGHFGLALYTAGSLTVDVDNNGGAIGPEPKEAPESAVEPTVTPQVLNGGLDGKDDDAPA